jgi:hypothetical protein
MADARTYWTEEILILSSVNETRQQMLEDLHTVLYYIILLEPVYQSRCSNLATGWTVRGSNPGRGKIFFSSPKRPDGLWGPPSLLFNGYRGFFPGVKRPGRQINHSPPSSAEIKNE